MAWTDAAQREAVQVVANPTVFVVKSNNDDADENDDNNNFYNNNHDDGVEVGDNNNNNNNNIVHGFAVDTRATASLGARVPYLREDDF